MIESLRGSELALPIAEEALAVARGQGGTVVRLHPLKAVMGAGDAMSDPHACSKPPTKPPRIDRTQRQATP